MDTIAARRAEAVAATMDAVRTIESAGPLDRARVEALRERLLGLAAQRELFPATDFPAPPEGPKACLYRIAEDPDGRFALYVNACRDETDSPVHNHTTWAVVVGFAGQELNRFYTRTADGVTETHSHVVEAGTGVAMLPDDLHSIHIRGGGLNFHMYGLALDRLDEREYFSERERGWKKMAAFGEIREARTSASATATAG